MPDDLGPCDCFGVNPTVVLFVAVALDHIGKPDAAEADGKSDV
jgi:hypothetical protein